MANRFNDRSKGFPFGQQPVYSDPYGRLLNGMMGDIWNSCLAEIEGLDAHVRSIKASLLSGAFYFISENHVLPRIAGSSIGVVRDDVSAGHFSFFRPE